MFVLMAVTLYTSRIVLNTLGVEDFGIYNVVGGIIVMFAFVNSAMMAATQRFLTYEMGRNNGECVNTVFNTSVIIHFALAIFILVLGETVGLWFFKTQLNIPEIRMNAAFWVYQFSIAACVINVISIPYNAAIIAYEQMSAFAWISLFDAGGRLLTALLLLVIRGDKLIWYALLLCVVQIVVRMLYGWYCKRNFEDIRFSRKWNKGYFKEMFAFSGWNMIGALSSVLTSQGLNVLLNIFFNPVANAAKGIADQVQAAVSSFYFNFLQAVNPQITKSYAVGEMNYMHKLMFTSSRLSFYIVLVLALPIVFETGYILRLWLKTVPENAVLFTRLSMPVSAIGSMAGPLITSNYATGKIKTLLLSVGVINCMVLPLSWIWLKLGGDPATVYWSWLIIVAVAFVVRLFVVKRQLGFSLRKYLKECLLPITAVSVVCIVAVWGARFIMSEADLWRLVATTFMSVVIVVVSVWLLGITPEEKRLVKEFAKSRTK
jgi:O-antigen/teichoic acid export membrane protein